MLRTSGLFVQLCKQLLHDTVCKYVLLFSFRMREKKVLKLIRAYAVSGLFLAYRWEFFSVEALSSVNSKSLNPIGTGIKN